MSDECRTAMSRRQALTAAAAITVAPGLARAALPAAPVPVPLKLGRAQPFNTDWLFAKTTGDHQGPDIDDGSWRRIELPHDWSIEDLPPAEGRVGPFDPKAPGGAPMGFALGGEGWYRRHFDLGGLPAGAQAYVNFDGIYRESDVWLNGVHLGRQVHGYAPFGYDLTPHLKAGDNVLAVRVRNLGVNSRWYPGSGIYRSVTLDVIAQRARLAPWGVWASTRRITRRGAEIAVETTLTDAGREHELVTRLRDASGKVVAETRSVAGVSVPQTLTVPAPRLWSPEAPYLYSLETELHAAGATIDRTATPFGIRILSFDSARGMLLNGQPIKLRGGCVHHDNGLLGAAAYPDAEERRVRTLKARGFNAVRSAHNPCSRAFADACDRLGMMIIEEAFDMWFKGKNSDDYARDFEEHWRADISAMVLSARNHPSVIMWSIGNEVPERSTARGMQTSWNLANLVRTLDPTRPVTAGINASVGRPVIPDATTARAGRAGIADSSAAVFLDVVGYNYRLDKYAPDHETFPDRVMFGSESYAHEVFEAWEFIDAHPYVIGDFLWAAIDYLGEAGMGNAIRNKSKTMMTYVPSWPWIICNEGDIDILGYQKPASLARDVVWGISPLEVAVFNPLPAGVYEHVSHWGWPDERQSWTWPDHVGKSLPVRVYSRADRIEIRVNGEVAGSRTLDGRSAQPVDIPVVFQPGTLEVRAWQEGKLIGRRTLETTGPATALRMIQESGGTGPRRLTYVRVEVVDAKGRLVRDSDAQVDLNIAGSATLIGFGNADPQGPASYQSSTARTFGGRALAIFRTERAGRLRLTGHASGLQPAQLTVNLA